MNKMILSAAVAFGALTALPAAASAQVYVGAGYTQLDTDGAGDLGAVTGRVGYQFTPNFAVEGEAGFGVKDDGPFELNHTVGAYAVGILPVAERFSLHGRLGYQTTEIDTPLGDIDSDGVAYGVGGTFNVTERFGVRADVTRQEGDLDADSVSLGGVLRF
ncbi:MAG TPA: porin family protein [Terricaulis sp.]|nr:porin family protein [Terricaulis sp.]